MARPPKHGFDYFPHDVDSAHDEKIESICAIYGFHVGYSTYFRLLERIYRAGGRLIISDEETMQILSRNVAETTPETFQKYLNTCLKLNLFDKTEYAKGYLTSSGVLKRTNPLLEKRAKMAEFYKKKVSGSVSAEETPPESTQSKVKESKVKESKVKESKVKNIITMGENEDCGLPELQELVRWYKNVFDRPPNQADRITLESFLKEFSVQTIKEAMHKGREILADKVNLSYVRGILYKTGTKDTGKKNGTYKFKPKGTNFDFESDMRQAYGDEYVDSLKAGGDAAIHNR